MVRLRIAVCLAFVQCAAQFVQASTMQEDLAWYRQSVEFSGGNLETMESLLNPTDTVKSFRLSKDFMPWAGNYFAMANGGVSFRWQDGTFPKNVSELHFGKLPSETIHKLSPIEKYDILKDFTDYRSTRHEMNTRGPRRPTPPQNWEGFCNGVRCAGILLPEPKHSVVMTSTTGRRVQFEPADLKALAGAAYFYVEKYAQMGRPTVEGKGESRPHPAAFDIALRHSLSKEQKAFVIDSNLGSEIWNETVVGYKRIKLPPRKLTALESATYPEGIAITTVITELETLGEIEIRDSNGETKSKLANGEMIKSIKTGYDLVTDSTGKVIDGVWHPSIGNRGVDFAWFASGAGTDSAYTFQGGNPHLDFKTIKDLFHESVQPVCRKVFW